MSKLRYDPDTEKIIELEKYVRDFICCLESGRLFIPTKEYLDVARAACGLPKRHDFIKPKTGQKP